ncbi:MAG: alkaline shock response membrane anchor protein AmaP [Syntrophomonadaceae bacterium]|nr:alkaline shock response membrane anchor protein AmaP [Syntrophomonadaceae bacterium]MDD3888510.1 alkaline shock response membrane anchor protein AmaP [Syntrophomonadaceae bacterium]MDD4548750.1 alkaline shock response membrane anchor protein AmaP [Syntrophomonadaceae bacterium]
MSGMWRLITFLYTLFLLLAAGLAAVAAMGNPEPLKYINLALSTPQNRIILGIAAIVLIVLSLFVIISLFKREPKIENIVVESNLVGQVSITIAAIKIIIMKAIKTVEGVKDIKPVVSDSPDGLVVYLHMMINPEYNVPEMSQNVQNTVKEYLQNTGGLKVAEIRVLVDDFGASNSKSTGIERKTY